MFASLEGGKRRPLDRALSGRAFSIDELACAAGAKVLRALRIETDRANRRASRSQNYYLDSLKAQFVTKLIGISWPNGSVLSSMIPA